MSAASEKLEVKYDNLIHDAYPPAQVFSVKLKAGQGMLERGTLLAKGESGLEQLSAQTTGKANAVLADPVDTGEPENAGEDQTVGAVAYRTGHFNSNMLIVAEGYQITEADKESLRSAGILISDAL